MRLAVLGASLLLAMNSGIATAEVEEAEHYDSLGAMIVHADAVVVGRVIATTPGERIPPGCGYTRATVRVESLVAGTLPGFATRNLTVEYFNCGTLPRLGKEIPARRAVFFLRNKGLELRLNKPDATQADLDAAARAWRLVILAGSGVDRDGLVRFPLTDNAAFLKPFEGTSFSGFVGRVRALGRLTPNTSTAPPEPVRDAPGLAILPFAAGGLAFVWVAWSGASRRRT